MLTRAPGGLPPIVQSAERGFLSPLCQRGGIEEAYFQRGNYWSSTFWYRSHAPALDGARRLAAPAPQRAGRWSVEGGIPTLERGNDQIIL